MRHNRTNILHHTKRDSGGSINHAHDFFVEYANLEIKNMKLPNSPRSWQQYSTLLVPYCRPKQFLHDYLSGDAVQVADMQSPAARNAMKPTTAPKSLPEEELCQEMFELSLGPPPEGPPPEGTSQAWKLSKMLFWDSMPQLTKDLQAVPQSKQRLPVEDIDDAPPVSSHVAPVDDEGMVALLHSMVVHPLGCTGSEIDELVVIQSNEPQDETYGDSGEVQGNKEGASKTKISIGPRRSCWVTIKKPHPDCLKDVELLGQKEMNENKISEIRARKSARRKRSEHFMYDKLYEEVTSSEGNTMSSLGAWDNDTQDEATNQSAEYQRAIEYKKALELLAPSSDDED